MSVCVCVCVFVVLRQSVLGPGADGEVFVGPRARSGAGGSADPPHTQDAADVVGSLLVYLKLYNEAERELDAFGELTNLDLYYQYHRKAYPGVKG